ncbi:MAG: iron-siderophore ABC transporter substrate-binding protein [Anaerolineae bacterium]|nr:iron-siderophore ABC transporter substrate-binding protein [Anaerolineae bacterium]
MRYNSRAALRSQHFISLLLLCMLIITGAALAQNSSECEDGFRLFEHELLATEPVCIPENPQRIVAVDRFSLETLLAVGIVPAASSDIDTFLSDFSYLAEQAADVMDIGNPPNLELVLNVQPDLIIGIEPRIADVQQELAEIAPTVSITFTTSENWKAVVEAIGAVVNETEAVEAAFDQYNARIETLKESLADQQAPEISVVFPYQEFIFAYLMDTFLGTILADAGLSIPQAQTAVTEETETTFRLSLTKEQLNLLDGDYIFVWMYSTGPEDDEENQRLLDDLVSDPLWQTLSAVQAGHVTTEIGGYWIGSSLIAANAVIDDLFTYIAEVDPAEVSPNPFRDGSIEATPEATEETSN